MPRVPFSTTRSPSGFRATFLERGPLVAALAASLVITPGSLLASAGSSSALAGTSSDVRITDLRLDLTLDPETGLMRETATVRLEGSTGSRLVFRIHEGLSVERSSTSEGVIEHRKAGSALEVFLDPPLAGARTVTFRISGRPRRGSQGLVGPVSTVLGPEDLWYPQLPVIWATSDVTVRTPRGFTAVAPGRPGPHRSEGVSHWLSKVPVRSLAVAAGRDWTVEETKAVEVPVRVVSPAGLAGISSAARLGELLSDPMSWLASALSPYPFDGMTIVRAGAFAGRVRASGMIVVPADAAIDTPSDAADLLAGQWFGERVAGDGRWMEAFEAWEACTYARDRALPVPGPIARMRSAYFELPRAADSPLSSAGVLTPQEVLRGKGSAVPDMVRLHVSDRKFFAAVQDLFRDPSIRPLTLAEVRAVFEARAGSSLARPFSEWFERADVPEFGLELRSRPVATGGYRVDLTLVQRRAVYTLPVEVVFLGAGQEHREVVQVDRESTALFYVLPFEPVRAEVDPGRALFRWPALSP